jgi:hypothetical protein
MTQTEVIDGFVITVTKLYFGFWTYVVTKGSEMFLTDMVQADDPADAIDQAYDAARQAVVC